MTVLSILGFFACVLLAADAVNYQVATGLQGRNGAVYAPDTIQGAVPGDTIEFILIGVSLLIYQYIDTVGS